MAITDEELTESILLASRAMVGIAVRSLASSSTDVTLPQYRTLVVLASGGPTRLADLAQNLGVSPSTATRMCDRLVRKELVTRSRDELDRREVNLAVTEAGRKLVDKVVSRRREEVAELLKSIPDDARMQLATSLQVLAKAAGETPELHWAPGWSGNGHEG
ncbi:MAG TPA: MarR family transcriptional regulator [Acidimicrobiales bacterium]|nr:MarR family transcriptional regulator [Acidimicrobiales bacterium]